MIVLRPTTKEPGQEKSVAPCSVRRNSAWANGEIARLWRITPGRCTHALLPFREKLKRLSHADLARTLAMVLELYDEPLMPDK